MTGALPLFDPPGPRTEDEQRAVERIQRLQRDAAACQDTPSFALAWSREASQLIADFELARAGVPVPTTTRLRIPDMEGDR